MTAGNRKRDRAHYLGRLRRRNPELADKVDAGELSCYAACRAAGIISPKPRPGRVIVSGDIDSTAKRIIDRLGADYAARLADELQQTVNLAQRLIDSQQAK